MSELAWVPMVDLPMRVDVPSAVGELERARSLAARFEALLAAVTALHQPDGLRDSSFPMGHCKHCEWTFPCPTAEAAGWLDESFDAVRDTDV